MKKLTTEKLISYCLKNYFIKRANEVADGKFVPQWYHEYQLERQPTQINKIKDLENKLNNAISSTKYEVEKTYSVNLEEKIIDLQNKLATINRISE